jgi:hypothetical protein
LQKETGWQKAIYRNCAGRNLLPIATLPLKFRLMHKKDLLSINKSPILNQKEVGKFAVHFFFCERSGFFFKTKRSRQYLSGASFVSKTNFLILPPRRFDAVGGITTPLYEIN